MSIPKDALSMENFLRTERNLPPIPERLPPRPDPELPVVEDGVKFDSIPDKKIADFSARQKTVRNKDGVMFPGYNFYVEFSDGKVIQGWLGEADFIRLKARLPVERVDLLQKIGW